MPEGTKFDTVWQVGPPSIHVGDKGIKFFQFFQKYNVICTFPAGGVPEDES